MAAISSPVQVHERAWFRTERDAHVCRLVAGGDWLIGEARRLDPLLQDYDTGGRSEVEICCGNVDHMDTVGAWLLLRLKRRLEDKGFHVEPINVKPEFRPLMHTIDHECRAPPVELPGGEDFPSRLERIGRAFVHVLTQAMRMVGFFGLVSAETVETIFQPRRLRVAALFHQMEETGLNALPIVGLLSFLIGVVFAYQGADQLRQFGAEVFTVNLLGISILRELGGLMAAIIVAGRSGSAFTAQIGTMRVNEEIDALETLGLNTVEVLVLPRLLALILIMPLLTFYSNFMGLAGGAIMCYFDLGITFPAFLRQLHGALIGWTFWVGMIKAPVFAFIIGLVGCFEGLRVERNAASVGKLTTQSVVESIFLVIVADAGFSVLFSMLRI
ncbi:MAG TPA: ABC transporter permease [Aliidongia sp.]|nr:ABC transporter permease [Aliidongia sp.]